MSWSVIGEPTASTMRVKANNNWWAGIGAEDTELVMVRPTEATMESDMMGGHRTIVTGEVVPMDTAQVQYYPKGQEPTISIINDEHAARQTVALESMAESLRTITKILTIVTNDGQFVSTQQ